MDDIDNDLDMENEPVSGIARWIPAVVVLGTIGSFIALACTAYHAGTQSLNEDELPVVEADSSPMKEKPLDPGGMKFPNQDKTIFETFSANPPPAPKVERVLPSPEEPMPRQLDTSQTTTWVKEKGATPPAQPETVALAKPDKTPSVMAADTNKPIDSGITSYAANPTPPAAAPAPAPAAVAPAPVAAAKPAPAPAPKPAPVVPAQKPVPTPAPAKPAPAPAKSAETASNGKTTVQLGAYRSDKEARDAWDKMQKKYNSLAGKTPIVVKADLGEKGIYYRLRTGSFADAASAKSFCKELSAKGQACLPQ